jgi:heptaprenyl diphosphate synthase
MRRGIPSLQKQFGKRTAVICGDYLFSAALTLAASVGPQKEYENFRLPDYAAQICIGELSQHIHNSDLDLSEWQYLKIISGKTAALFEASFYGGAQIGGCGQSEAGKYRRLGWYAGMIFQLKDDCNDFESTPEITKKTVQSDYEQNVITLPLIFALRSSPAFLQKLKTKKIRRSELNRAVSGLGGLAYAHGVADKFYQKATGILGSLVVTEEKRATLLGILQKTMQL